MVTKPYTTVPQQMALMSERGMTLGATTEQWLGVVNYYRLTGYAYSFRELETSEIEPQRADQYAAGTHFEHVAALYEFDRHLRALVLDGLERVEIALRRGITEVVGVRDPLGYRDPAIFRDSFDHARWLTTVSTKRLERARRRDAAVKHHFDKYNGECPIWVVVDVLDFADASVLFNGMRTSDQFQIAEAMGITIDLTLLSKSQREKVTTDHPMARWFEQATVARNICAHHGRLWNRGLVPANSSAMRTVDGLEALPPGQSESVFGLLCFIAAVLDRTSPGSRWAMKVAELIVNELSTIPFVSAGDMGAPDDWRSLRPWQTLA